MFRNDLNYNSKWPNKFLDTVMKKYSQKIKLFVCDIKMIALQ